MPPSTSSRDSRNVSTRRLTYIWIAVLGAPIAWAASLLLMSWLTRPVCAGVSQALLTGVGASCVALAIGAGLLAWGVARRGSESPAGSALESFLLRIAMWMSALFTLVIALSMAPIAVLTPCPL